MFNLFKHEVTSRWISILGWGIGLIAFSAIYITIYPQIAEEMAGLAELDIYVAMGIEMATFAGFIASVVIQIMPIILGIYVIMTSTATLAGEDDNGTLELIVAMPLKRWQIVITKALALSLVLLLIMVIMGVGSGLILNIVSQTTEIDVTPFELFMALMGAYPMLIAFFCMGLFFGTIMPTRRMAVFATVVIYIGSYVINSAAALVDSLDWLETLSLFSYVNTTASVFTEGLDLVNIAVLFSVALVFLALAVVSFEGRNVTVGQWVWQR